MDYVLDANALIAFLNDEDGADTVSGLLAQAEAGTDRLFISSIQALEVYYDRIYIKGRDYADTFLESLFASAVVVLPEVSRDVIREAGRFKTSYSMSLADSVACATASCMNLPLVTADHHELEAIVGKEAFKVFFFR